MLFTLSFPINNIFQSNALIMVKGNASQNSTSQLISTFTGIGRAQPDSEIISNDLVITTANSKGFIINFIKKNNLEPFILSVRV